MHGFAFVFIKKFYMNGFILYMLDLPLCSSVISMIAYALGNLLGPRQGKAQTWNLEWTWNHLTALCQAWPCQAFSWSPTDLQTSEQAKSAFVVYHWDFVVVCYAAKTDWHIFLLYIVLGITACNVVICIVPYG